MHNSQCLKFHSPEDEKRLSGRIPGPIDRAQLATEWTQLLDHAQREQDIQDYLERHPELLPGINDLHHGPMHRVIVSKFPFGADPVCDFAFVTANSMALRFTFVEIEDPCKRIFNRNGEFSQHFHHARQQILDWKIWAEKNEPLLVNMFSSLFESPKEHSIRKTYGFYLIYGRRKEIEADKQRQERWSSISAGNTSDINVLSYDRLIPNMGWGFQQPLSGGLIVCTYQKQAFFVKSEVI